MRDDSILSVPFRVRQKDSDGGILHSNEETA